LDKSARRRVVNELERCGEDGLRVTARNFNVALVAHNPCSGRRRRAAANGDEVLLSSAR
jgi:hypothetical protein